MKNLSGSQFIRKCANLWRCISLNHRRNRYKSTLYFKPNTRSRTISHSAMACSQFTHLQVMYSHPSREQRMESLILKYGSLYFAKRQYGSVISLNYRQICISLVNTPDGLSQKHEDIQVPICAARCLLSVGTTMSAGNSSTRLELPQIPMFEVRWDWL